MYIRSLFISIVLLWTNDGVGSDFLKKEQLTDSLYVFFPPQGAGLNVVAHVTDEQILLVDALNKKNDANVKLLAELRKLSSAQIRYLVKTDSDYVHEFGYRYFEKLGATIVTHVDAPIANELRTLKYDSGLTIKLKDDVAYIDHYAVNSFDDASIYFQNANVLVVGNIFLTEWLPIYFVGGVNAMVSALDDLLLIGDEQTKIIAAKGPIRTKAELRQYREKIKLMHARIGELVQEGATQEAMLKDEQLNAIWQKFSLSNKKDFMSEKIKRRLLGRYIGTDFVRILVPNSDIVAAMLGQHTLEDKSKFLITAVDHRYFIKFDGWYKFELLPVSSDTFVFRGEPDSKLTFENIKNCQIKRLVIQMGDDIYKTLAKDCERRQ